MTEIATAPTACEAPARPVRVIWHEVACPAAHQLDATVALFARFDANYVKHARDERDLLQQLTSRLTPEMRREVDAMLAEL